MASLAAAHKGYLYQDIATAYFLARSLVEPVRATTVDAKAHANDRFDDISIELNDGSRVRRQFKHSDADIVFEKSFLCTESYKLRLDQLIKSSSADHASVRAKEYRVCVTWRVPAAKEDARLLKSSLAPSSFGGQSRCFQLDVDAIWPKRQSTLFKNFKHTKRADLVTFAKRFVIELECPRASLDLERPGPMERLLIDILADRVGFGRYPNHTKSPIEAAAQLILLACKTRGADSHNSTLTVEQLVAHLGLVTDYGRIAQQFPFKKEFFVSVPELRQKLIARIKAGGITVLSGGPGAGKSWELTDLMRKLRAQKVIVAAHYCYLEPGDPLVQNRITLNAFYGNLMAEIIDAVPELREHSPTRYSSGPTELQALIDAAGKLKPAPRLVVVVDGLDHIARVLREASTLAPADTQIARDLLALKLPKNVSVLVGSQPGDHIERLSKSGTVLQVPPWDEPEVEAFVARNPVVVELKRHKIRGEERTAFITELANRSQGNALYCTYLCKELENRLGASPGASPFSLLKALPPNDGNLATYYEFLLGNLDEGGRLVGQVMGLIDFGVTPRELREIFPLLGLRLDEILKQLKPILEETRGQGGLRIYHESFRRHLLEKSDAQPGSLGAILQTVIAWLDAKGFLADPRAFRFLLPNLVRAGRNNEALARIERDFVVQAVIEGHPAIAIDANLKLYARVAADTGDFVRLVRAAELSRALDTFEQNLSDAFEYGTTFAAIFGNDRLAERLAFDGAPTFKVSEGLKLCSFVADAGLTPPWHAYLRKPRSEENQRNIRADIAHFHGLVRTEELDRLRVRLVKFLADATDEADAGYLASLARRWGEIAGADDLPRLQKEAKCRPSIAEIFDLEFARLTKSAHKRVSAATRVARNTANARHAIAALALGANPTVLTHWTTKLDEYPIGISGRRLAEGAEGLSQWVLGIRISAYVQQKLLAAEEIRIRGPGWYRSWLAFVIELARIERRAVHNPTDAADEVVEAFRVLSADVHPFKGDPRACDLLWGHHVIHESFHVALELIKTPEHWRKVLNSLKKISSGTTTSLQRSKSGPLTANALVELVAPFAKCKDLQALIRRELEPLVQNQHHGGLYNAIASDEMALAAVLMVMGDRPAAMEHWKAACTHLCAYGERRDVSIFEVLESVRALKHAGKSAVLERLAQVLPMANIVIHHTDGKDTSHVMGQWFEELLAVDDIAAAWLLGRSMTDDGGSYDYRLEDGLRDWMRQADGMDARWRFRLEQLLESSSNSEETKCRLARIEALHAADPVAAELEFQLLSAAVHGDPADHPEDAYKLLVEFATKRRFSLPTGGPVVTHPQHGNDVPYLPDEPEKPTSKLRWQPPKTPLTLLQRLQEILHDDKVTNAQLFDYCAGALVEWANTQRAQLEEILTVIARANRFEKRTNLLSRLGTAFEQAGRAEAAARALTLAFTGHCGGGGWLSFGDETHEDLLVRAFAASRPVALSVLAQEMALRSGHWGVTRHVIGFLGRHDDISLATAMWDEARASMLVRMPGHEDAHGPFLPLEPTKIPAWSRDDAALFLVLARISNPERGRKTAAICGAAWLVQQEPAKCVTALRAILQSGLCYTHQLWVLQLLGEFEATPFVISQGLAPDLNALVGSGRCGTEQLAVRLLNRAKMPVTGTITRTKPLVSVTVSQNEQRRILSLDTHDIVSKIAQLWPDFPEIVAGRFQTILKSDESNEDRMKARWEAAWSIGRKSYPPASIHGWEKELFSVSLHEVLTGLEAHLWSTGDWDEHIWTEVLSLLLPDVELPARHYWSRRVRPSWPLPNTITASVQDVQTVPDGDLAGWIRVGYFETYLDTDSRIDEIKTKTHVTTGVILAEQVEPLDLGVRPIRLASSQEWMRRARPLFPLAGFSGGVAGFLHFGIPFKFHELLGLVQNLPNTMNLSGRQKIGPLDLFDADGELATAFRWWQVRPLGTHGFADETPRLNGGALLMRPDVFARLVAETKLQAFEAIRTETKTTEDLIASR